MPALLTRASALAALLLAAPACAGPVSNLIYPAPQQAVTLDGLPSEAGFVDVTTADGLKLRGIFAPGNGVRPLLLVFHGNASSAQTALQWLSPLAADGFSILSASYRGYSGQPGRPSEAGLLADARAFLAAARARAAGRPVWLVGHSLGGGVALALAREQEVEAVVIIGTFTRLRDMAPRLGRSLVPDEYRNIDAVKALGAPLFLIHGGRDEVVPAAHGERLFEAATGRPGRAFLIRDAGHVPDSADLAAIFAELVADRPPGAVPALAPNIVTSAFRPGEGRP